MFKPEEYSQSGTWKIKQITTTDIKGNTRVIKNSNLCSDADAIDMSAGDFEVTGTAADTEAPIIEKASIKSNGDGDIATEENFHITLNATDSLSGIKTVYVNYTKPSGDKFVLILNKSELSENEFYGSIPYANPSDLGSWTAVSLVAEDNAGNQIEIKDSNKDLSFTFYREIDRIERIANATVYKENTYVSYETIQGDVYIGPNAVVTLDSVNVTGNIYVLGGARLISVTAGGVYGSSMSFGYSYGSTFYNGTIYFSGSNSVGSMGVSSMPVTDIPVEIVDNKATSEGGKLHIKGATLDIADFYIADNKIDISNDGKFVIKDIEVGDTDQVSLKWTTVFGNTIEKIVNVDIVTTAEDGTIHYKPRITASDATVCEGETIDLKTLASAYDTEDGDITGNLVVAPEEIPNVSGSYKVDYSVTDSKGAKATKTINVTVGQHIWDVNSVISDPTCTTDGETSYVCLNCGKTKTEVTKATGHTFDSWAVNDATCTEDGSEYMYCSICGAKDKSSETIIPAYGHSNIDWGMSDPSCTSDGYHEYYCERCGTVTTETIPATGHQFDSWYVVVEPTIDNEGVREHSCMICGMIESEPIAKLTPIDNTEADNPVDNPTDDPETDGPVDDPAYDPGIDDPVDDPTYDSGTDGPVDDPAYDPGTDNPADNPAGDPGTDDPVDDPAGDPRTDDPADNPSYYTSDTQKLADEAIAMAQEAKRKYDKAAEAAMSAQKAADEAAKTPGNAAVLAAKKAKEAADAAKQAADAYKKAADKADEAVAKVIQNAKTDEEKAVASASQKRSESLMASANDAVTKANVAVKTAEASINDANNSGTPEIKLSTTDFTYKFAVKKVKVGKKKKKQAVATTYVPTVSSVVLNGRKLTAADYDIAYSDAESSALGQYKVTVTLKGKYKGTGSTTYNINPKPAKISKPSKGKKKMTIKWKKAAKNDITYKALDGYEIQYSLSSDFSSDDTRTTTASKKAKSKAIKKLQSKQTYYVRIRTYKNAGGIKLYSGWSAVKSVKVK